MRNKLAELLLILFALSLVCGCNHKGEVADLIEQDYKNMSAGGSVEFVTYSESHTTEWRVRTFRAHGTVKWDNLWYVVARTFKASHGMPDILIVEECKALNDGVRFDSTFYRGGTDAKGHVSLQLPKADFMTEKDLVAKFPKACIMLPTGKLRGCKIDESLFEKNLKRMVCEGEKLAVAMKEHVDKTANDVDECIRKPFKDLNDEALQLYRRECELMSDKVKFSQEGLDDIRSSLRYFRDFPVAKMRRQSVGQCLVALNEAEKTINALVNLVEERASEVREEQAARKRKGVVFLKPMANQNNVLVQKGDGNQARVMPGTAGKQPMTLRMGTGDIKVYDVEPHESISVPQGGKSGRRQSSQRKRSAQ